MSISSIFAQSPCRSEEGIDTLELELKMAVSYYVNARNQNQSNQILRVASALNH